MKAADKKMAKKKSPSPAPKKATTPKAKSPTKPAPAAQPSTKKKKTTAKTTPASKPAVKPAPSKKKAAGKKTLPKPAPKKAAPKPAPQAAKKKTLKADPKPKAAKRKVTALKPAAKKTVTKPSPPAKPKAAVKKTARVTGGKKAAPPVASKKAVRKSATKAQPTIPAFLLEGDAPPADSRSGPGARYDLGPDAARPHGATGAEPGELPDAYGTGLLVATARDPHWLYVFWDLTEAQQTTHNQVSRDGHLILRLFSVKEAGRKTSETHVHPESRNWFVPVPHGGQKYSVEIGYYTKAGKWQSVSESRTVATPPDSMADDTSADFATLPAEIPFEQLLATVRQVVSENVPLLEALEQLRAEGYEALPGPDYFKRIFRDAAGMSDIAELTPAQKEALAEVITMDEVRRVWIGSHEITELVKGQLVKELASQAAAGRGARAMSSAGVSSLSSPFGGEAAGPKDFWFNVNAELIIYGATEPDARVTIGGHPIQLRGDGTFSYRFALPDGRFDLPIQATNADGDDSRDADLAFSRDTQYRGDVGRHPQDERLKTPRPENTV